MINLSTESGQAQRFALAVAAGESLAKTSRLWRITQQHATSDWKRHAGASSLIQRHPVHSLNKPLDRIETNLGVWSVPVGAQRLCFLPDRLLVLEGSSLAFVEYGRLDATFRATRFIEDGAVPADAEVIERTWQFVNKSGGPDRRFKQNRELPVVRYGELELRGEGGLHLLLQTSRLDAASRAVAALTVLRDVARGARSGSGATDAPQPQIAPAPPPERTFDGVPDAELELATAITILLSWLARADRKFGEVERLEVEKLVISYVGGSASLRNAVQALIDRVPRDDESAASAMLKLRRLDLDARAQVVADAWRLALADGKVTPKEKERLALLIAGLEVPPAVADSLRH